MVVATKIRYYRKTLLQWLALRVYRYPIPILVAAVLLALVSGYWTATHLGYQTNPNDLLKPDARYHQKFLQYLKEFRDEEDFIIVVSGPKFERNREAVEWLAERIKQDPDLAPNLFYKVDFAKLEDRSLLFLEEKDLEEIDKELGKFSKMMQQSGWQLNLNGMLDTAQKQLDPDYMDEGQNWDEMQPFLKQFVDNLNMLADRLEGKQKVAQVQSFDLLEKNKGLKDLEKEKAQHEYIAFNEGKVLLVTVMPERKEHTTDFFPNAGTIKKFNGIIEEARKQFPGLEIGLTGEPVLSQDEMEASTKDCTQSTIITLVLISLLFGFAYREFWRPFFAIVTLLIGVAWTMGFATVTVGHLNLLSQAFVAMILGLGIDFGIQLLGRYEEALSHGKSVAEALDEMMSCTGGAIITGGSTTAAAFFTMCFNQFRGLAELGIIAGAGVLLCLVAQMLVLPALITLRDRKRSPKELAATADVTHWGSGRVDHFLKRFSKEIVICAAVATVGSIWCLRYISFDYNLLNLQSKNLESVKFERKLLDTGSKSIIFGISIVDNIQQAKERVAKFKKLPTVLDAESVTSALPENQAAKMKIIKRIHSKLSGAKTDDVSTKVDVEKARLSLSQLKEHTEWLSRMSKQFGGEEGKMASKVFEKLTPPIDRALNAFSKVSQEEVGKRLNAHQHAVFGEMQKNLSLLKKQRYDKEMGVDDLPKNIVDRFRGKTGKIMIQIYPKEDVWEREPLTRFVEDMRKVDPDVTGTPVQNYEYIELLKVSYLEATGEAMIAIAVLIMLHFRSFRLTALTLLPLGLGMAWTLIAMPLLGLRFNPANIITLPLVVGAGVAYGVYTVDRYRELGTAEIFGTSTGKAILLSALTTIIGFGSLIPARHQGIASLGTLMTIGITMCMITSLYVLPALIELSQRPGRSKPRSKSQPALR